MKINVFKKGLVIGIIALFIGTVIIPMIGAFTLNYKNEDLSENSIGNPDRTSWWNSNWVYCKKITIDYTFIAGNLQNFPILVYDTSSYYTDHAQSDGDDFVFVSVDNTTKYSHEIEYYDSSSGELVAWVKIPTISSTDDTVLYIYYGNPTCNNQQNPDDVWDSNYLHVWHLGDNLNDSTGLNDGINYGTRIIPGKIGNARDFEQSEGDYINLGDMSQPSDSILTTMTWEGWVKPESLDMVFTCKYNTQGEDLVSYWVGFDYGGKFHIDAYSAWGSDTSGLTVNSYSEINQWVYLTSTYNLGGLNELNMYINGDEVAFSYDTRTGNFMANTAITDDIGRYRPEVGTKYADGVIDEMRWSKTVRTDDWIKTSYNTMNYPNSFLSVGPEVRYNTPAERPTIDGPITGNFGTSYEYTFSSTDPEGDDISYNLDWGDGYTTNTDFYNSGFGYKENHTWITEGTYIIKAKTIDIYGAESDWNTFNVVMPRNKIEANYYFFSLLERFSNQFPILQKLLNRVG